MIIFKKLKLFLILFLKIKNLLKEYKILNKKIIYILFLLILKFN